jgi:hypothetical protein
MVGIKLKNRCTGGWRLMCFLTYSDASLMIRRRVNRLAAASMAASDAVGFFISGLAFNVVGGVGLSGIRILS